MAAAGKALKLAVKRDFDEIALLRESGCDHNGHYRRYLLSLLPPRPGRAADLGCGIGAFTWLLAERSECALALDFSEAMVQRAKELNPANNIEYRLGDLEELMGSRRAMMRPSA